MGKHTSIKTIRECTASVPVLEIDAVMHTIHTLNLTIGSACISEIPYFARREPPKGYRCYGIDGHYDLLALYPDQDPTSRHLLMPIESIYVTLEEFKGSIKQWGMRAT